MTASPFVVFGATSGTGTEIVRQLVAAGRPVRVAARNVAKARALFGDAVEIVEVDLLAPGESLETSLTGVSHVLFTAGVPRHPAGEALVRATEHDGTLAVLEAAKRSGFRGRFVYLTTLGLQRRNLWMSLLDTFKWNLAAWRLRTEDAMRASGVDVVLVRAGLLTDRPGGGPLHVIRGDEAMTLGRRIPRADVARLMIALADAADPPRDVGVWAEASAPSDPRVALATVHAP